MHLCSAVWICVTAAWYYDTDAHLGLVALSGAIDSHKSPASQYGIPPPFQRKDLPLRASLEEQQPQVTHMETGTVPQSNTQMRWPCLTPLYSMHK